MADNITTVRGFLLRIDVGRQGLVVATLLQDDGTTQQYQIPDLDADPERFNEQLSRLGIMRDAMNRAEPVEIEYSTTSDSSARTIERAVRITRDSVAWPTKVVPVEGLVSNVQLFTYNHSGINEEKADYAKIVVMQADLTTVNLTLDLQVPERLVVEQQLQWILSALNDGSTLQFFYDSTTNVISGIGSGNSDATFGGNAAQTLDGFVESLSPDAPSGQSNQLALFRFTTAPAFAGAGNYVPLQSFTPTTLNLLVLKNSPSYALVEAALRECLRMEVSAFSITQVAPAPAPAPTPAPTPAGTTNPVAGTAAPQAVKANTATATNATGTISQPPSDASANPIYYLASNVTLLAPLASASRPVWIKIERELLDDGPERRDCTDGLPINDLAPRTLRDLCLPYPAAWEGWGCFNHGVYRFQFKLTTPFEVFVDGERLCVHTSEDKTTQFAHACLCGEQHVEVKLEDWTCAKDFVMDVYRIR
jgi:hypothetical protein